MRRLDKVPRDRELIKTESFWSLTKSPKQLPI